MKAVLKSKEEGIPPFPRIDFLSAQLAYRRRFGGGRRQLIAKAVGLSKHQNITVLDLTAGLGQDACVLAMLGCKVTMLERSPFMADLLRDGLMRAQSAAWFRELKLTLVEEDALHYLPNLVALSDVIYYDPMYPERKKSAWPKQGMRLLRQIVGDDNDSPRVLELALKKANQRVVVKRPRLAPVVEGFQPSYVYSGKSSRYDVYVPTTK